MTIAKAEVAFRGRDDTAAALRSVIRNAETAQRQIASRLRGAFNFLGAGTALYGITRALGSAIRMGDDLAKFAQKSGLAAEAASELAHAAKMADIDLGSMETGIKKMQITLSQAASGSKAANATLEALGLTFKDLRDKSPDQQLEILADQIMSLKSPADRTRAAVELFGRAGADLLPLFEQGAAGIRAARREAQELGKSFSDEDLRRFQMADTAFKQLTASSQGLASELAIKLAPALAATAKAARDLLRGDIDWAAIGAILSGGPVGGLATAGRLAFQSGSRLANQAEWAERSALLPRKEGRVFRGAPPAPGFEETAKSIAEISQVMVTARRIVPGFEGVFSEMLKNTATDAEKAAHEYEAFKIQLEELLAAGRISPEQFNERMDEFFDKNLKAVEVTAQRMVVANDHAKSLMATLRDELARENLNTIADLLYRMSGSARDWGTAMLDAMRQVVSSKAAAQLVQLLSGLAGSSNGLLSFIGMIFGGVAGSVGGSAGSQSARTIGMPFAGEYARGGFLPPGHWGIAGEHGPEPIFGGRTGKTILPTSRMGGKVSVSIVNAPRITVQGGGGPDQERRLQRIINENSDRTIDRAEARIVSRLRGHYYDNL